jgi:hypothetical protein
MRFRILLVVLGTMVGISSLGSFAATPVVEANQLQPRVLIIFKNGLSWIEHRGEVALTNGWGSIPTTPEAVFGTVSLTSDEVKVDEIRTTGGSRSAARGGSTLESILTGSAGRMVTLRVGDREVSGRLLPSEKRSSADVELFQRNGWAQPAGIVLVGSGGKTTAIPGNLITAVTLDGEVPPTDDRVNPSLRFHVAESSASVPVRLSYVRPGIGWFPDYSIKLDGDGRAALTMRATLVDDGEDLRDTDVFFAVGVPNFAFGQVESPLSAGQSLAELFRALGQGAAEVFSSMANSMNNVVINTAMPNTRRTTGFGAVTTEGTSGESAEDFFFYSRKGITLARGERAAFPLLEASVKYSDLYTLDIPREAPDETTDKVWHSIRLENPTKLPWTTAPALVIADGRPVAQEILQYTPANGETTLRLTVANSIVVDRHESEAARQRESVRRFDNTWDAVTVEGTIDIRNFKDKAVVLAITRDIEGEAIRAREHRVTRIATTPRAMNPIERLEWEISLGAGEQKTIKYQYKVFVRE